MSVTMRLFSASLLVYSTKGCLKQNQILRQRGFPVQNLSGHRVFDHQQICMEGLSAKGGQRGLALWPELTGFGLEAGAIDLVAEQGMAEMGEVDADLVSAAGLELAGEQGGDRFGIAAVEGLDHFPVGDRITAALTHRHFLTAIRVPVDRLVDGAGFSARRSPGERHVAAPHFAGAAMVGELRRQRLVGAVVLGHHHQAGGVLVEPVDDAGTADPADAGKAQPAMGNQRVDQRSGLMPGGGMHHEILRLVDDDDVVVLEHDIERDVLAFGLGGGGGRHVDCDRIPRIDMISGVANPDAADAHLTCEDQRLQARARQVGTAHGEHAVQPPRSFVAVDRDLVTAVFVFGRVRRALHV